MTADVQPARRHHRRPVLGGPRAAAARARLPRRAALRLVPGCRGGHGRARHRGPAESRPHRLELRRVRGRVDHRLRAHPPARGSAIPPARRSRPDGVGQAGEATARRSRGAGAVGGILWRRRARDGADVVCGPGGSGVRWPGHR